MSSIKIQEAFINEFKGNIFEFLVASYLSRLHKIEKKFIDSIPPEYKNKLNSYENILRLHRPDLVDQLLKYSNETARVLNQSINQEIFEIQLCGKISTNINESEFKEADIILTGKRIIPISLKLTSESSYVFTKSAGVKSFLSQYFSEFADSQKDQNEFNHLLDLKFQTMANAVHEIMDIEYDGDFNNWRDTDLSELPGEQTEQVSTELKKLYSELIIFLHQKLTSYHKQDPNLMASCILPLLGMGRDDLLQVICFYTKTSRVNDVKVLIVSALKPEIVEIEDIMNNTNFLINLQSKLLQVRIKPMNKFTTPAFKVNCSVKYLD